MKVSIKDFNISLDLGNNGITFDIYDNDEKFLGDLRLGKGTIEWCQGKTRAGNGVQVTWTELLAYFEDVSAKKAEKDAAKKTKAKTKAKKKA